MPCAFCGARQTDPVRGASPWRRAVRQGVQVLVCPDCQQARDWTGEVDACAACGSTVLVRALGETHCRSCGSVVPDATGPLGIAGLESAPGLAEEVDKALDRLRPGTRREHP